MIYDSNPVIVLPEITEDECLDRLWELFKPKDKDEDNTSPPMPATEE